jgi:hypothetical protein
VAEVVVRLTEQEARGLLGGGIGYRYGEGGKYRYWRAMPDSVYYGSLKKVRKLADEKRAAGCIDVRISQRTITTFSDGSSLTSPWTDLPGEGEGNDG